jgi:DNA-binding winged helix-turn-helix (wHTH) protein/predicted ATPase/Cdc6-like AAA superfamily ATPase
VRQDLPICFGPFRLDVPGERLWRDATPVALTPKGFALLRYLAEHPGRLLRKQEVLDALWADAQVTDASLYVCIREVRQALGDNSQVPQYVQTVHRRGYRFIAATTGGRATGGPPDRPASLVGRDRELVQLKALLQRAGRGDRQVVFVTGEPGIGKTALADAFLHRAGAGSPLWAARGQCCEHHGPGEAFAPLLEALSQLGGGPAGAWVRAVLARYAPTWLAELPALSAAAVRGGPPQPASSPERMVRELNEAVEALTAETPVVLVLEDLHWSDHATVDLICSLAQRRHPARMLVLATYRTAELIVRQHPLRAVQQELQSHGQCEELPLGLLSEEEVAEYLAARFSGCEFAAELARPIHRQTDGNPLFMVNVVDYWVAQGRLSQEGKRWQLKDGLPAAEAGVPDSVRGMIERQAEQLGTEELRLLEAASAAGVEFSAAAVAATLDQDAGRVEECCEGLVARHQFLCRGDLHELPGATVTQRYHFAHTLYKNAFYQRIPPARRVRLHRRIVDWGEAAYGEHAAEIAAELAEHAEQGRDFGRAARYHHLAAAKAARLAAHREAVDHARRGLDLLDQMGNASDREGEELGLLMTLGLQLQVGSGFAAPGVGEAYARARELCGRVPAGPQLGPLLWGLFCFYAVRAANQTALEVAEQLLQLGEKVHDPLALLWAHNALGIIRLFLGELVASPADFERAGALYTPEQHRSSIWLYGQDPKVTCLAFGANGLWLLGDPDRALAMGGESVCLARQLGHAYSLAFALFFAATLHQRCGQPAASRACAEEALRLSEEHGFLLWSAGAMILRGKAVAEQGALEEGIADIRRGLSAWQSTGAVVNQTYYLALLGDALGAAGHFEEGLAAVAEAMDLAHKTGEQFYEAELYRLKGELLLQQAAQTHARGARARTSPARKSSCCAEAAACFHKAITIARQQGAQALELRTAKSLCRLAQFERPKGPLASDCDVGAGSD